MILVSLCAETIIPVSEGDKIYTESKGKASAKTLLDSDRGKRPKRACHACSSALSRAVAQLEPCGCPIVYTLVPKFAFFPEKLKILEAGFSGVKFSGFPVRNSGKPELFANIWLDIFVKIEPKKL